MNHTVHRLKLYARKFCYVIVSKYFFKILIQNCPTTLLRDCLKNILTFFCQNCEQNLLRNCYVIFLTRTYRQRHPACLLVPARYISVSWNYYVMDMLRIFYDYLETFVNDVIVQRHYVMNMTHLESILLTTNLRSVKIKNEFDGRQISRLLIDIKGITQHINPRASSTSSEYRKIPITWQA